MVSNAAKALLIEFRSEVEHFCADVYYDQLQCEKPMVHLVPVEMVDLVSGQFQLSNKRLSVGQFCYIAMNKACVEKKI